jgi:hypothetical protein
LLLLLLLLLGLQSAGGGAAVLCRQKLLLVLLLLLVALAGSGVQLEALLRRRRLHGSNSKSVKKQAVLSHTHQLLDGNSTEAAPWMKTALHGTQQ